MDRSRLVFTHFTIKNLTKARDSLKDGRFYPTFITTTISFCGEIINIDDYKTRLIKPNLYSRRSHRNDEENKIRLLEKLKLLV